MIFMAGSRQVLNLAAGWVVVDVVVVSVMVVVSHCKPICVNLRHISQLSTASSVPYLLSRINR